MSTERDELAEAIEQADINAGMGDGGTVHWESMAGQLIAAGYRKIFDGDCGLSNVTDKADLEAAEAWMRWANISMGDGHDGISAMKQMLTEFGYRKDAS